MLLCPLAQVEEQRLAQMLENDLQARISIKDAGENHTQKVGRRLVIPPHVILNSSSHPSSS